MMEKQTLVRAAILSQNTISFHKFLTLISNLKHYARSTFLCSIECNNNNNSGFYLSFSHLHIAQLTNIIECNLLT